MSATRVLHEVLYVTRPLSVHQKCRLDTMKNNLISSDVEKRPTTATLCKGHHTLSLHLTILSYVLTYGLT